jgi:hypothetical protein
MSQFIVSGSCQRNVEVSGADYPVEPILTAVLIHLNSIETTLQGLTRCGYITFN